METQWIRSIRRSGRKDAGEQIARVGPWVDLEDVAMGSVKPRDDDDFVAKAEALKCFRRPRTYLEPRIGRPLRSLFGRFAARLERRADHADRSQPSSDQPACCIGAHQAPVVDSFAASSPISRFCTLWPRNPHRLSEGAAPNELVPEPEPLERAGTALGEEALRAPGKRKFRASPGQHRRRVRFANPRSR